MENRKFDLKKQGRSRLKAICQAIPNERRLQAAVQAYQTLLPLCQAFPYVLSFASFKFEIDLFELNQTLALQERLILPRIVHNHLQLFRVTNLDHLEKHPWGILEPNPAICEPISPISIEIALIPGLGFDLTTKHRLGYGKGYYDRLLLSLSQTQTWGIGFQEQAVENLPYDQGDVALDHIQLF